MMCGDSSSRDESGVSGRVSPTTPCGSPFDRFAGSSGRKTLSTFARISSLSTWSSPCGVMAGERSAGGVCVMDCGGGVGWKGTLGGSAWGHHVRKLLLEHLLLQLLLLQLLLEPLLLLCELADLVLGCEVLRAEDKVASVGRCARVREPHLDTPLTPIRRDGLPVALHGHLNPIVNRGQLNVCSPLVLTHLDLVDIHVEPLERSPAMSYRVRCDGRPNRTTCLDGKEDFTLGSRGTWLLPGSMKVTIRFWRSVLALFQFEAVGCRLTFAFHVFARKTSSLRWWMASVHACTSANCTTTHPGYL
eukprot:Sspe_Gene.5497::Locus_1818_Transcript_1_1_Confidence_1.000_Length_2224::g.5497::m.5497